MALDSPVVQGFQSCLERDHSCVVKAMNHKSISRELKNVRLGVIVLVDSGFTGEMAEKSWESICKSSKPVVLVQLADWEDLVSTGNGIPYDLYLASRHIASLKCEAIPSEDSIEETAKTALNTLRGTSKKTATVPRVSSNLY
eukprot:m.351770 g.351770  ORF g.351770 m.351770 type:complete len:142 (-) comp55449_c0_seq1:224-649(-)